MLEHRKYFNLLPSDKEEVNVENFKLFFKTMYERQRIWKRRMLDGEKAPWTLDPILRDNKFTNVYRELDRSSQWQIRNIILDKGLSPLNLIWKILVYRTFNNSETFSGELAQRWRNGIPDYKEYDEEEFAEFISAVRNSGKNPFTNAYLINSAAMPGKSRDYCYCHLTIPTLHHRVPRILSLCKTAKSPKEIIELFKTIPTIADFVAHEYYQDLTYIGRYTGRKIFPFTQNDFTNVGPGASEGIRLIFPSTSAALQINRIYELRDMAKSELPKDMPYLHWDKEVGKYYVSSECNITLHQIEMWLCEFQKYWKMLHKVGKQRSKFQPHGKTALL